MNFSWILLIIFPFYLELKTIRGSEELYVVKNRPEINGMSRLTCMSKDDGAALTWNFNRSDKSKGYEKINYLNRYTTVNNINCGIWRWWQLCIVDWEKNNSNWHVIDSITEPMGPVVDHRWEGFIEYDLNDDTRIVNDVPRRLNASNGILIFSIRGKRDIHIDLCENSTSKTFPCFLIKIAVQGIYSVIKTCVSNSTSDISQKINHQNCKEVKNVTHKTAILDEYEWRTFRLEWTSKDKTIKLFNDADEEAFLQGHQIQQWHSVNNISIASETAARIRFHYYYYRLTKQENAVLITKKFDRPHKNFCINMMVSLCPGCRLNVSLISNRDDSALPEIINFGNECFDSNGLRSWRLIRLNKTLESSALSSSVRLRITSVLNKVNQKEVWWAIDDLRFCEETNNGVTELTTMTPVLGPIDTGLEIKCQKLFHTNIVVADLATSKSLFNDVNQFRQSIQSRTKFSSSECTIFLNDEELTRKKDYHWFITIPILVFGLLILFICYWRYRRVRMRSGCSNIFSCISKRLTAQCNEERRQMLIEENELNVASCDPHSHPVKIEELEKYVEEALAKGLLNKQWKKLPRSISKPCRHANFPENRQKNRFDYAVPYDDNRIILEKMPNDSSSDYINASYVQGYNKRKAYIATQGPKRDNETNTDTVTDFWKMIWQENVRVICMLTNVIENGKRKCEQYWPEVGKSAEYGNTFVLNLDQQVFTEYTTRTLQLMCPAGKREIKHFHFTGWPEHSVPMFTQSLAAFMSKLLATPVGKGPMVVHSCAGTGRTGTLISCDISLRQAIAERVINIPRVTFRIRQDRAHMVDTVQQYLLVHLVVAECKILERTQIPCTNQLEGKIFELRKQLLSDVKRLKSIVWQDRALHSLAEKGNVTSSSRLSRPNNRYNSRLAKYLCPVKCDSRSDYIHAVSVEGVKRKEQFIAIRQPSPSTLPDLWSLIVAREIELIIVLQQFDPEDKAQCDIIPNEPLSYIQLLARSMLEDREYFTTEKLLLVKASKVEPNIHPVTILRCTGWVNGTNVTPPRVEALVSLWMASEKIQRKENPILVICRDGVTGCGLYLALSFLLDRMSIEKECDVISAVRAIQRSSPNFVQSLEQFEYLYDAALNYNTHFVSYANFS